MQVIRTATRTLRPSAAAFVSLSILSHRINGVSPEILLIRRNRGFPGYIAGSRGFSQSAACSSPGTFLDKQEVTTRVVDLLKSIPFVDPAKVNPTANFKDDLQLDMLDNVKVMVAVEEEFAVDIPDSEANKFSSAAHLIEYIATHPQAK